MGDGGDCSAQVASITYNALTPEKCGGDICKGASGCTFWKYVREGGPQMHTKHCYLLDQNQCTEKDENVPCPDFLHDEPLCQSGYEEGVDCGGSEPPSPEPPRPHTTDSPYDNCPGPIELGVDGSKYYQKWFCYEKLGENGVPEIREMYGADSSMPVGGYCELTDSEDSCKTSTYRHTCTRNDNTMKGEWKNDDDDQDLTADLRLKEIGCSAPDYKITPEKQEGRMISCVNEITANTLKENNACIMLCDNIPAFSIYTDFVGGGQRNWVYELTNNPDSKGELASGMLDCWGKR